MILLIINDPGDIVSLLEAMVEMQTALKHSAYSHYLKLTLIMIHTLIGASLLLFFFRYYHSYVNLGYWDTYSSIL